MDDMREHLASVSEELRVADGKLRAQQELIDGLLRGRSADQLAGLRLAAALPVPLLQSHGAGLVLRGNPAAAILLQVAVTRLRGKPLASYVQGPVAPARRADRAQPDRGRGPESSTSPMAVQPRGLTPIQVDAVVLPTTDPGPDGTRATAARWVLAPRVTVRGRGRGRPAHRAGRARDRLGRRRRPPAALGRLAERRCAASSRLSRPASSSAGRARRPPWSAPTATPRPPTGRSSPPARARPGTRTRSVGR